MKGLIFVYLLTAFGVVGSFWTPLVGLFVYVAFAVLRPQFLWGFAGDMNNLSLMVGVAMLAAWAMYGFGDKRLGRSAPVVALLLAFLVWTTLSAAMAFNSSAAYPWVIELLKIVAPFLVGVTMLKSPKHARAMLWLIVAAQAYISWEMNASYYFENYNRANDSGYGGMDNNSFGISLVTTIGPAFALVLFEKKWIARLAAAACAVLILHATLLTFSRGAMVGLLAVGITAFVLMPKKPSYVMALTLAALLAIRLTGPQLLARYSTTFVESDERDQSADSRLELWKDCLSVAADNPLFGVGPRNWPLVAVRYGWPEGKEAHSTWMQTTAEMGFPGVSALLMFFVVGALKLWPMARRLPDDNNRDQVIVASGVVMTIAGFVVAGQFVTLVGLEIPYYFAMVGMVVLKGLPDTAAEPSTMKAVSTQGVVQRPGSVYGPSPLTPGRAQVPRASAQR